MTTLNLIVGASADDARELDNGTGFSSTGVSLTAHSNAASSGRNNLGFRFTNVTISPGATINSAVLTVNVNSTAADDPNVQLYCEDVDDAVDFATNADVTSRATTTATTQWTAIGIGTGDKASPDFAAAVQEVIDRGGWASGNDICVLMKGRSDVTQLFQLVAYDSSTVNCARLAIDYTAPATGNPAYYYAQQ